MEKYESYGLEEIHALLLNALDEFDSICKINGIQYSLHGGALLGAERNGKLIPWDDDLDISMTRRDFTKFKEVCDTINGNFYLNELNTWLPRFTSRDKSKTRIFIDVFIWDYISQNKVAQFLKINILRVLQGMLKKNIDFTSYNFKEKILVALTYIIGIPFSRNAKLKLFKYIEENWFLGKKKYIHRSNDSFKGVSYIFDRDYMKDYEYIQLEDKKYMVNSRYKEFLERSYGADYLTPPPEEERKPLHATQRENFFDE